MYTAKKITGFFLTCYKDTKLNHPSFLSPIPCFSATKVAKTFQMQDSRRTKFKIQTLNPKEAIHSEGGGQWGSRQSL